MKITINTTKQQYFRQVMTLFQPFLELGNREILVLSELARFNYMHKNIDEDIVAALILNKENRKDYQEALGLSQASFNNAISVLTKGGYLIKNGNKFKLKQTFKINPDVSNELTYKFTFNE